jgi:hypothetical protein
VEASELPGITATAIDDPWLVANEGSSRWDLYFTVRTSENDSSIARISSGASFDNGFDYGTFEVVAEPISGFPKMEMPSVVGDEMIARAANVDLGILVRLDRDGSGPFTLVGGSTDTARIHGPDFDNVFAMDRDEVADPALVEFGGVKRLYFAGRSGTRWRVGLLVSIGGQDWYQPLFDDPVWKLDDIGFDALQARDPAPLVDNGQVSILYIGGDGTGNESVGRAYSGSPAEWP